MPSQILVGSLDFDSIRAALAVERDAERFVTDRVILAWSHLPLAEAEAFNRYGAANIGMLLSRDPFDPGRAALKAGVCALTCAFLCPRMEISIPIKVGLENGQTAERTKIDWLRKRQAFIADANWAFSLTGLENDSFPRALSHANGFLYKNDPLVNPNSGGQFVGYVSPLSGTSYSFVVGI